MGRCFWIRRKFRRAVTNELADEEREEFDKHLRVCGDCSREFRELCQVDVLVAGYGRQKPPERLRRGYWPGISLKLKESQNVAHAGRRKLAWTLLPSLAGAMVALAAVWFAGHVASSRQYGRLLAVVEELQGAGDSLDVPVQAGFVHPGIAEISPGAEAEDVLAFDFDEIVQGVVSDQLELVPFDTGLAQQWL